MCHPLRFRRFAPCILAGAAALSFFVPRGPAVVAEEPAPSRSVYHADPEHLWNRLYEALFVRVGPDGRAYGQDRLEPLLWRASKHLLEEHSNKSAIALLEEVRRAWCCLMSNFLPAPAIECGFIGLAWCDRLAW